MPEFPYTLVQSEWKLGLNNKELRSDDGQGDACFYLSPRGWHEYKQTQQGGPSIEDAQRTVHRVILDTREPDVAIEHTREALQRGFIDASARDRVSAELSKAVANQPYHF